MASVPFTAEQLEFARQMTRRQWAVMQALADFPWWMSASDRADPDLAVLMRKQLAAAFQVKVGDRGMMCAWEATAAGKALTRMREQGRIWRNMAITSAILAAIARTRKSGRPDRSRGAGRSWTESALSTIARPTTSGFKTPDDLRQLRQRSLDERRVFEALWSHDAIELDSLVQQSATPSVIRDWAEDRWYGTPKYQTTFKSCDQFVRFVE